MQEEEAQDAPLGQERGAFLPLSEAVFDDAFVVVHAEVRGVSEAAGDSFKPSPKRRPGARSLERAFSTQGTGQSHPQKKRPRSAATTRNTAKPTRARGRKVFEASIASRLPKGQIAAISAMPNDEAVPQPVCTARPRRKSRKKASAAKARRRGPVKNFFMPHLLQ